MIKNYFIQVGTSSAQNIFNEYNIYVSKAEGLNDIPEAKETWSRDWKDEQGLDTFVDEDIRFESKNVKLTFVLLDSNTESARETIKRFINYVVSAGVMSYFDTYRSTGFVGYYNKNSINTEKYRASSNHVEFDLTFVAPNGICYGYNNEGNTSMHIEIKKGFANLQFSDGTNMTNISEDIMKNQNDGFAIACPSSFRGVKFTRRSNIVFGTRGGVVIGTRNGTLIGN